MVGANYYLVSALPKMGSLGTPPPMGLAEMLEHVADSPVARQTVATVLLADDLVKRQALLAGETKQAEAVVLTAEQLRDEAPLPEYLAPAAHQDDPAKAADSVWAAYFRHAAAVAARTGSEFLSAWVGYEVGLRNALAEARAAALGLEAAGYAVAKDLAAEDEEFSAVVEEWTAAPDPLRGQQALDRARWDWLERHDRWFTFADDELTAYAAKLVLLHRWGRLTAQRQSEQ